ncbi:hypothetical protein Riv7116_5854 [Rivularia sp. PCC 7116]|uniref:hypothetical protein n=1 Tax=Rivularia sp. PCC 7116 TaxID=373994 RepID=UPI00029ECFFE|nr:hypothetical protein [Rivularia sp. PCC 7116]AFY58218.1 hypothetical protein Riv7116_5854 [Rivularia sp. PCC 7116]
MNQNNQPNPKNDNRAQFTARFGCGFIFGIFFAFTLGFVADAQTFTALLGIIFVSAVICGLLSAAFGDKFWHWLRFWI